MLRDKPITKRHDRVMDAFPAALKATWAADPGFQELAKFLYGDEVTVEEIAKDLGVAKSEPDQADVHVPGNKRKLNQKPQVNDDVAETVKRVKKAGNAFIELVSKAHEAGLIDDEGNLDAEEIGKSRDYIRDHAGRFAESGLKTAGGFAAAGLLAGGGAALASKAPEAVKYAGEASGFVARHLVSKDPVERHIARSLLPHAMRAMGEAVGHAGGGAVLGAGGVMEGTRTYDHMRRVGKKLPDEDVEKDWRDFDAKRAASRHKGATATGVLAVGSVASEGAGRAGQKVGQHLAQPHQDQANMWRQLAGESKNMGYEAGSKTLFTQAHDFEEEAARSGKTARRILDQGKKVSQAGRKGAIGLGTAAGVVGYGALIHHENQKYKQGLKKNHDVTWEGEFSKVDEDKRQVFGWASVTEVDGKPVIDLQGDYVHPEEMEKAAYDYVLKSRVGGDMHARVDEFGNKIEKSAPLHISDMIESMVFTPEKVAKLGLPEGSLPTGWWVGFAINDAPTWELVKRGERTGFSIHGQGVRKELGTIEDPEDVLVGKAFEESETTEEFAANLDTIAEVTGLEGFHDLAKHLSHGIHVTPQQAGTSAIGVGIGGGAGREIGALAGMPFGDKGARIGQAVGGLTGMTAGGVAGFKHPIKGMGGGVQRPPRPPSVHAAMGQNDFAKAVSTSNRKGTPGHLQDYYTQMAVQQATQQMAPQVAQHIEALQRQRMAEMMVQQQMMAGNAQQQPQDFTVQMGPYSGGTYGAQGYGQNAMTQSPGQYVDPSTSGMQNTARQASPSQPTSSSGGRNG